MCFHFTKSITNTPQEHITIWMSYSNKHTWCYCWYSSCYFGQSLGWLNSCCLGSLNLFVVKELLPPALRLLLMWQDSTWGLKRLRSPKLGLYSWINKYNQRNLWNAIHLRCPFLNGSLVKPPLELGHRWVIASHDLDDQFQATRHFRMTLP